MYEFFSKDDYECNSPDSEFLFLVFIAFFCVYFVWVIKHFFYVLNLLIDLSYAFSFRFDCYKCSI